MVRTKDLMVSKDAFMRVFEMWWPLEGGLPEELTTLDRVAKDRNTHRADVIFRLIRRSLATGVFDG